MTKMPINSIRSPKRVVDWDAIEPHYRAGIRALKDIGAQFQVSDAAIIKHATKHAWTRNLTGKVQARADALVSAAQVSAEVSESRELTKKAARAQVVEVEANVQARIRLSHRALIGRTRKLVEDMLAELEVQSISGDQLRSLLAGIADCSEEGVNQAKELAKLLERTLKLGDRAAVLKTLVESLSRLVAAEREAYNIGNDVELADPFSEFLRGLQARAVPVVDDPLDVPSDA